MTDIRNLAAYIAWMQAMQYWQAGDGKKPLPWRKT
jgi:hypothetical protein